MIGLLITGDLQDKTMTFKMDLPMSVVMGKYEIRKIEDKPTKLKQFDTDAKVCDIFNERIKNQLHSVQVYTVMDLMGKSSAELSKIRNLGKISLLKIQTALKENEFQLNDHK